MKRTASAIALAALIAYSPAAAQQGFDDPAAVGYTKIVELRHRDASEVIRVVERHLKQGFTQGELARMSMTLDEETNSIIFRAASDRAVWLSDSLRLIGDLDAPTPQALVEVALIGPGTEEDTPRTDLERATVTAQGWQGAVTFANTRFLASRRTQLYTPVDPGTGLQFVLFVEAGSIDWKSQNVFLKNLELGVPVEQSESDADTSERPMEDDTTTFDDSGNAVADEPEEPRTRTATEPVISVANLRLEGGAAQALGPFPISYAGGQAMLVVRATFPQEAPKAAPEEEKTKITIRPLPGAPPAATPPAPAAEPAPAAGGQP
ncbi:MAG: hypothetical protein SF028_12205 [Candidatus Sumerlaeia bacterium]|nr:hypothetical protein [Candidatus Sumerlaeia bacterium]